MKRRFLSAFLAALAALALCAPAMAYEGPEAEAAHVSADSPETAAVKNGWVTSGGKRYYYKNGRKALGLWNIGGKTYYFNTKDGHMMKSGWVTVNGRKYYLAKDGHALKNGWVTVNGRKYYLAKDGHMLKNGWVTVGSKRYYLAKDGHMLKGGWLTVGGSKYYLAADGHMMKNGLIKAGGKLYYLNASGVMLKSQTITVNGRTYYLGADGVAVLQSDLFKKGIYLIDGAGAADLLGCGTLTIHSKSGNTIEFSAWWHRQSGLDITTARISGNRATFSTNEAKGYLTFTSADTVELTVTDTLYTIPLGKSVYHYFGTEKEFRTEYNKAVLFLGGPGAWWSRRDGAYMRVYFRPDGTMVYDDGRNTATVSYSISGDVLYVGSTAYGLAAYAASIATMSLRPQGSDPYGLAGSYVLGG